MKRPTLLPVMILIICHFIPATRQSLSSEKSNIQFLMDLTSKVDNPEELVANVQAAFANPEYLDKIFTIFEASDFPDTRPWVPEVEKKRFQDIMLNQRGNVHDQYKYLEIILNKVNTLNLSELEKIYTMSESLDFVIDFYQIVIKAEEDSSKFKASLEKGIEEMKSLTDYVTKSMQFLTAVNQESQNFLKELKGQEGGLDSLMSLLNWHLARMKSPEYIEHHANILLEFDLYKSQTDIISMLGEQVSAEAIKFDNLAQMAKLLSRHAFNVNFQIGLSGFKINTGNDPKITFDLDVVKKLKDAYERVEGLRNMVLVEKDVIHKIKLEQELKEAENFLDIFVKKQETMDQVRQISDASNLVVSSYAKNTKEAAEIATSYQEMSNQYKVLFDSRKILFDEDSKFREMVKAKTDEALKYSRQDMKVEL